MENVLTPRQILVTEHDVIKRMLAIIDSICDKYESENEFIATPEHLRQIVDFIRNYADGLHHAKEEDILFKVMEEAGISLDDEPVGPFMTDHTMGRFFTGGMSGAVDAMENDDASAEEDFVISARAYTALLTRHIHCEDDMLFELAEKRLSEEQMNRVKEDFDLIENNEECLRDKKKYLMIVTDLERVYLT
jgi:hemerythrin-like domain-containing protein